MGVTKVHYRCDGAGCFNSHEAKAPMMLWPKLTGTTELSYKVMVSGKGKTNLDGYFGVLGRHLRSLVDMKHSFTNARELYQLLTDFPLQHSHYHLFLPTRDMINWYVPSPVRSIGLPNAYLLLYDEDSGKITVKIHSRHSEGKMYDALDEYYRYHPDCGDETQTISLSELSEMRVPIMKDHLCWRRIDIEDMKEAEIRTRLEEELIKEGASWSDENNLVTSEISLNIDGMYVPQLKEKLLELGESKKDLNKLLKPQLKDLLMKKMTETHVPAINNSSIEVEDSESSINIDKESDDCAEDHDDYYNRVECLFDSADLSEELASSSDSSLRANDMTMMTENMAQKCIIGDSNNEEIQRRGSSHFEDANDTTTLKSDPARHILLSTFDHLDPSFSSYSKIGWRERVKKAREDRMNSQNAKIEADLDAEIIAYEDAGLYCCNERDPKTKQQCTCQFVSKFLLERHKKKGSHDYPCINSMTSVILDSIDGKFALCLACGSRKNRDHAVAADVIIEDNNESLNFDNDGTYPEFIDEFTKVGCYRKDNTNWKKRNFTASKELLRDIEFLYTEGERRDNQTKDSNKINAGKYTPEQALAFLKNLLNADGSRKYSLREDNPNGPLPSVAYVKSKFSARKRDGAKRFGTRKQHEKSDTYQSMDLAELKEACVQKFGAEILKPHTFFVHLLRVDDSVSYGQKDGPYELLKLEDLKLECRNRQLPITLSRKALQIILRAKEADEEAKRHKESNAISLHSTNSIMSGMEMRQNVGAERFKSVPGDKFEKKTLAELKELSSGIIQEGKILSVMLLEIDDILRYGRITDNHCYRSKEAIKEDCHDRNIPSTDTAIAFRILLRSSELTELDEYFC